MKKNYIYQGHVLDVLKTFPDESVNMVITSPPYWNLRNYNTDPQIWNDDKNCDHEWDDEKIKLLNLQTGNPDFQRRWREQASNKNSSQGQFCQKCGAWKGSLGLEPDYNFYINHLVQIFDEIKRVLKEDGSIWVNLGDTYSGTKSGHDDPKNKNVNNSSFIKFSIKSIKDKSLIGIPDRFKINMIDKGWICRNEIIWYKKNKCPESVKTRFTTDFEKIFFFVKNPEYYFEQQFEPYTQDINRWGGNILRSTGQSLWDNETNQKMYRNRNMRPNSEGRNKRCVWSINTMPFSEAHFGVFPEKLIETPIKAGCPKGGVVLDPFFGSGTTGVVALNLERSYVGIELNSDYIKIAEKRLREPRQAKELRKSANKWFKIEDQK